MLNDDNDEDRESGRDAGALRRGAANSSTSGKDESENSVGNLDRAALDGLVEHGLKESSNMHPAAANASLPATVSMPTAAIGLEN